jgi:hypothetical protein
MQQFGSRKNTGAGSASDFLRAKRINAIRASGDIKANTATSGYDPLTIVQFNSVVQELNNVSSKPGGGGGGGNVPVPPLPPIGDSSFVFQIATTTAVFSFDSTAPAPTDISWGGPGSLSTLVDGDQTTYSYTYSDGNPTHNVLMSNVTGVTEVAIYQTPRPAAPSFTISGVTSTALDTYTLHISPVAGATSYFLALDGVPTNIIQPTASLSYQVEGVCGRTYANTLATMKQGRIGDFSAAQSYSIPALPKPSVTLEATGPTTFTATVTSTVLEGSKRVFEIYQLSGGTYSNVAQGTGTTFSLTGGFHTNQSVYANLVYNVNSTISSDVGNVLLPNALVWIDTSLAQSEGAYINFNINPSSGRIIAYKQSDLRERSNNIKSVVRTDNLGLTFTPITLAGITGSDQIIDITYLNLDTWFITSSNNTPQRSKIFRSVNDGSDWSDISPNTTAIFKGVTTNGSDTVIAYGNGSGFYYSSNRGSNWEDVTGVVPHNTTGNSVYNVIYTPCAWFGLGLNAQNTSATDIFTGLVYSENGKLWKSVSGAFSTEVSSLGDGDIAGGGLDFDPTNHIWVLGKGQETTTSDHTLFWSVNASEWYPALSGAPSKPSEGVSVFVPNVRYENNVWIANVITIDFGSYQSISSTTCIRRSTDGKHWDIINTPSLGLTFNTEYRPGTNQWIAYGADSYLDLALFAGSNSSIFSSDNGLTWERNLGLQQSATQIVLYDTSHDVWVAGGAKLSNAKFINGFLTATATD